MEIALLGSEDQWISRLPEKPCKINKFRGPQCFRYVGDQVGGGLGLFGRRARGFGVKALRLEPRMGMPGNVWMEAWWTLRLFGGARLCFVDRLPFPPHSLLYTGDRIRFVVERGVNPLDTYSPTTLSHHYILTEAGGYKSTKAAAAEDVARMRPHGAEVARALRLEHEREA